MVLDIDGDFLHSGGCGISDSLGTTTGHDQEGEEGLPEAKPTSCQPLAAATWVESSSAWYHDSLTCTDGLHANRQAMTVACPKQRSYRSSFTTAPPFITQPTRDRIAISVSGSAWTAIRSANFPAVIEPTRSSQPMARAACRVADWIACI